MFNVARNIKKIILGCFLCRATEIINRATYKPMEQGIFWEANIFSVSQESFHFRVS